MTSPPRFPQQCAPQAALWLTLAQAFLPPVDRDTAQAFLGVLSQDLRELCADVGLAEPPEIADFEDSLASVPDPRSLLEHYSRLFLAPPARARLNLSYYLDGRLNGDCQDYIDAILARHGARRRDAFHDLSDHVAALLELLALLSVEDGGEADRRRPAHDVVLAGLAGLARDIEQHAPRSPYGALARLAWRALEAGSCPAEVPATVVVAMRDEHLGGWHTCRQCGETYAREGHRAAAHGAHRAGAAGRSPRHLSRVPQSGPHTRTVSRRAP